MTRRFAPWHRARQLLLPLCAGLFGAASLTIPATAQTSPVEFACPAAGTSVRLSNGARIDYQGSDPTDREACLLKTTAPDGESAEAKFLFAIHSTDDANIQPDHVRQVLRVLFPLGTTRQASALVSGPRFNSMVRYGVTLEGPVSVTVPAGRFSAWKLKQKGVGVFGNELKLEYEYWLDEKTLVPLRITETVNGNTNTTEAVEIKRKR